MLAYNMASFIGHNFGDYKNCLLSIRIPSPVLSVIILETTKTREGKLEIKELVLSVTILETTKTPFN